MTIEDYANLPENRSGFWVEKSADLSPFYPFRLYYQRMAANAETISDGKRILLERYAIRQRN